MLKFIAENWKEIILVIGAVAKGLQALVGGVIAVLAVPPKWLLVIKTALDDIVPNLSFPQLRTQLAKNRGMVTQLALVLLSCAAASAIACAGHQKLKASKPCDPHLSRVVMGLLASPCKTAEDGLKALSFSAGPGAVKAEVKAIIGGMEHGKSMGVPALLQVNVLTCGRAYLGAQK